MGIWYFSVTGFPDFLDGELVAIPGMDTVGRVYSSQGDRGPQGNSVAILGGCRIGEQQGRAKCAAQQADCFLHRMIILLIVV